MKNLKEERLGEVRKNKDSLGGYEMKIVEYYRGDNIIIEFQDEYKAKICSRYDQFENGSIKNPYHPSIYDVAYMGQGEYNSTNKNGKHTIEYEIWRDMIRRCYDPYWINNGNLTYKDSQVYKVWLNFQNFAKWYNENKYGNEKLYLDKDILMKRNKIYSPETCVLVPKRINNLFTKNDINRGIYPIGVSYNKQHNKFYSSCSILDENGKKKKKSLGYYNTPEEAFLVYKNFKENYIKQVDDEYYLQNKIPKKVYNALYNWIIEIDD